MSQAPTGVPEAAVHSAARIIAASLRQRHDQIVEGRMGDVQTETPNQIAERALAAALPSLEATFLEQVKERRKAMRKSEAQLQQEMKDALHQIMELGGGSEELLRALGILAHLAAETSQEEAEDIKAAIAQKGS